MTELTPMDSPTAFAVGVLGILPHAKQAEFLESRARIKVACAGRCWGKSMACAIDVLWRAMARPSTTQLIVAPGVCAGDGAAAAYSRAPNWSPGTTSMGRHGARPRCLRTPVVQSRIRRGVD